MIPEAREHGWATFPVYGIREGVCTCREGAECGNPGKHPIPARGVHEATIDEARLDRWAKANPGCNVGVATGRISGIAVVDVDPKHGGPASHEALRGRVKLPRTLRALTGSGGWHDYYRVPDGCPTMQLAPGIDLRGDGAYVVAPPSVHVSGNAYKWLNDAPLAELPAELVQTVQREKRAPAGEIPERIPQGQRESTLVSLAGSLRRRGASERAILAAIEVENERCDPPLAPKDLERIARSVSRYAPEPSAAPNTPASAPETVGETAHASTRRIRPVSVREFVEGVGEYDYSLDYLGAFLRGGERTHVLGPIGNGKTTFIAEALRAAVAGEDFLGLRGKGGLRACLLALEMNEYRLLETLTDARLADLPGLDVLHDMDGFRIDESPEDRRAIDALAAEYDVLAIDPWYKLLGEEFGEGMLRQSGRVARFFDNIKARNPRTAIIVGFHTGELQSGETQLRGLGSATGFKVFQRDCDTAITFLRRGGSDRSTIGWAKTRSKDLPKIGAKWHVEWERGEGFRRIERTTAKDDLAELLTDAPQSTYTLQTAAGIGRQAASDALNELALEGRAIREMRGRTATWRRAPQNERLDVSL